MSLKELCADNGLATSPHTRDYCLRQRVGLAARIIEPCLVCPDHHLPVGFFVYDRRGANNRHPRTNAVCLNSKAVRLSGETSPWLFDLCNVSRRRFVIELDELNEFLKPLVVAPLARRLQ